MSRCFVMRIALAGGLAGAAAAAARDVPVYREYTLPISFADEADLAFAAAGDPAPDLAARRELRDTLSREALLGRETLLDLGLGLSAGPASVPGKLTPPALPDAAGGTQPERSRNWLVESLTLPTLGQTASNAATAVMVREGNEPSRDWLVDEVAKAAAGSETTAEKWMQEQEASAPYALESGSAAPAAVEAKTLSPRAAPMAEAAAKRNAPEWSPLAGPDPRRVEATWPARTDLGGRESPRDTFGGSGGSLSQTRQIIADYVGSARPDFAALRATLVQADPSASIGGLAPATDRSGDLSASRFGLSSRESIPTAPSAAWQGGWRAESGANASRPYQTEPVVAPIVPSEVAPRPSVSSGGYKPAWY